MAELSDLHRAKRGVAVLVACVVQTLGESDPSFERRFLGRLAAAYRELKDNSEGDVIQEMELLSWTRELLTGFSFVGGQQDVFLKDYKPGDHDHVTDANYAFWPPYEKPPVPIPPSVPDRSQTLETPRTNRVEEH